jgi:serine/threonine-protein kinase HipA
MELAFSVAGHFGLENDEAQSIAKEVAGAVSGWRSVARAIGATEAECDRMASAFEHGELAALT